MTKTPKIEIIIHENGDFETKIQANSLGDKGVKELSRKINDIAEQLAKDLGYSDPHPRF